MLIPPNVQEALWVICIVAGCSAFLYLFIWVCLGGLREMIANWSAMFEARKTEARDNELSYMRQKNALAEKEMERSFKMLNQMDGSKKIVEIKDISPESLGQFQEQYELWLKKQEEAILVMCKDYLEKKREAESPPLKAKSRKPAKS